MNKAITFLALLAWSTAAWAQQELFSEDFEGSTPAFTLNTTAMGSSPGGANFWMVGNAYAGGSGTMTCFGFPFSYDIPDTPTQPAGIGNAGGNYLHIASQAGFSSGITNANFAAADGLCTNEANHFAAMATDVSTVDADEVTLSFWWLCAGSSSNYGEVYYSTDGGASWNLVSAPNPTYYNQGTWTQQTISLAAFAGQPSLRFGFRFVNQMSLFASDPSFAIDDVVIEATVDNQPTELLTGALAYDTYCAGSPINVPYTATGSWAAGNVFTAELSDVTGSFTAPVTLGSLPSTASGTIAGTIPANTPAGTGYQVRVIGSNPAQTGTISVTAITIVEAPYAGQSTHMDYCRSDEPMDLLDLLPGASDCGSWTYNGQPATGTIDPATAGDGAYVYTTDCYPGCPPDQAQLTIMFVEPVDAGEDADVVFCAQAGTADLFLALGGTPDAGGTWTLGVAPMSGWFDPGSSAEGCYTYTVTGVPPCPSVSAEVCVTVDPCLGIDEFTGGRPIQWLGQEGGLHTLLIGDAPAVDVRIYDAAGQAQPLRMQRAGDRLYVDLGGLPAGIYVLRILADGMPAALKIAHQ